MSWSLEVTALKAVARDEFLAAHQRQPAYADVHQRPVMDLIAAFGAAAAEAAPADANVKLASQGHVQSDGHGSVRLSVSFWPVGG